MRPCEGLDFQETALPKGGGTEKDAGSLYTHSQRKFAPPQLYQPESILK